MPLRSAASAPATSPSVQCSTIDEAADPSRPCSGRTVNFGERIVKFEEKQKLVAGVFSSVADRYDLMNDLMSGGIHRWWKSQFVNMIDIPVNFTPQADGDRFHVLDVGGGTGDIAFKILDNAKAQIESTFSVENHLPKITVSDINADMLDVGRERARGRGYSEDELEWMCADGSQLPVADNTVDVFTIAFAIRNFTDISAGLREAYRVLRPGGRFLCLEFSNVPNPILATAYDAYSFSVIPNLGSIITGDRASYKYLVESIRKFPSAEEFACLIADAQFGRVTYSRMTFGVVAVHSGFKLPPRD